MKYGKEKTGEFSRLHRLIDLLDITSDCCSIALDGGWGSGKTFFVKQAKMLMDAFNTTIDAPDADEIRKIWEKFHSKSTCPSKPQVSVYYDAWENDNDEDPLLSIVYEILKSVKTDYSFKADISLLKIAASIAEILTGRKVQTLIDSVSQEDPFAAIKSGRDLQFSVNEFFESLLPEQGERLIIFIDELDRCKPTYAVRLLERIKHYFMNDKITFVLSVNSHELQNTVKQYYGDSFNACRYLDRFFDLRIALPPVDMGKYYQSISFYNSSHIVDATMQSVIKANQFSLREIAKYVRITKIAIANISKYDFSFSDERAVQFSLLFLVPIMIGLKMHSSEQYKLFVSGKDETPLLNIVGKGGFGAGMCNLLLCSGESYYEVEGKTTINLNNKLKEVYDALFAYDYSGRAYETNIGQLSFSEHTRQTLLRTVGLLSGYSDFN